MTARAHQALDTEPPAPLQASALTPGKSLSGFIPLFLLPVSSAKSIKAVILLTNFSWKSNPIGTTKLEANNTYICRHQDRPLHSTTPGTESHSQRGVFGTPDTWEKMYDPGQSCWPFRKGQCTLHQQVTLPSQPLSFLQHQALCWLGSGQEMGQRHPHRLEPWALAAASHTHRSLCLQARGAETGAEVGRNSTGLMVISSCCPCSDSSQRWSEPQPPRVSLPESSQHAHTS